MSKRYDEEFRREAVKLVIEGGVKARRAARDLGVSEPTLSKWISEARGKEPKPLSESEREELKRLRKENSQLRMERDILKKATAYFAKDIK
jgi:transposase